MDLVYGGLKTRPTTNYSPKMQKPSSSHPLPVPDDRPVHGNKKIHDPRHRNGEIHTFYCASSVLPHVDSPVRAWDYDHHCQISPEKDTINPLCNREAKLDAFHRAV